MVSSAFDPATNPMQIIFLGDALAPIIPDQITCKMFVKRWHFYNLSNFVWTIVFARIDTDARWEREGGRGSAWRHRRVSMQKRSRRRGLRAETRMKSPTRRTSRTNRTLTILTMLNGKQAGPTQRQSPDTSSSPRARQGTRASAQGRVPNSNKFKIFRSNQGTSLLSFFLKIIMKL